MTVFGRRVAPTRLLGILVLLMNTATSRADESMAKCLYNEQGWLQFGEKGKDVCSIAQTLMNGTCQSHIPSLHIIPHSQNLVNMWYTVDGFGKDGFPETVKRCACDRVMFNLLSACAGCQKWRWSNVTTENIVWQTFTTYQGGECTNSAQEKRAIPWTPDPPAWATTFNEGAFDPNAAQAAIPPETTSVSPSSTNPASEAEIPPTATGEVAQYTTASGPAIGAIVGGVIGGLIFLGAIAGLAYWLYCRKRRARDVAPSSEFLKPEYFLEQPPLLPEHERRESAYRDEIEEETRPSPTNRRSWVGGFAVARRHEEEDDDDSEMLPPFTQGTYIGPSPHEKGCPARRDTGDTDITMRTNNTTTFFLPSASPTRRPGPSDYYP
ncbi:hypothetical protein ACGC1H_002930 [Rhizoctonia solani]|uniref:Uncharacterized protein n=1 Tax=Rhizoctonia solani TaxID=456999 RepID=A0A8H3GF37_9AGAM|nr:unnamed protein product [Rhizoctonia solani]